MLRKPHPTVFTSDTYWQGGGKQGIYRIYAALPIKHAFRTDKIKVTTGSYDKALLALLCDDENARKLILQHDIFVVISFDSVRIQ